MKHLRKEQVIHKDKDKTHLYVGGACCSLEDMLLQDAELEYQCLTAQILFRCTHTYFTANYMVWRKAVLCVCVFVMGCCVGYVNMLLAHNVDIPFIAVVLEQLGEKSFRIK